LPLKFQKLFYCNVGHYYFLLPTICLICATCLLTST